jgi:hypothetical protein
MIHYPFQRIYKLPLISNKTGQPIGRQKIRINAAVCPQSGRTIIVEERFIAISMQSEQIPSGGKLYKGFVHCNQKQTISADRVFAMGSFIASIPPICQECKNGFEVLVRPGKIGCTHC